MKSIVRRDTGEDWKAVRHAADARGRRDRGRTRSRRDEEMRRFDKKRKDKKVSNDEWVSPDRSRQPDHADEGRPHAPGLQGRARGRPGERLGAGRRDSTRPTRPTPQTLVDSVMQAQVQSDRQRAASSEIEEVAADKGYHAAATLELCDVLQLRTYIPEPRRKHDRAGPTSPRSSSTASTTTGVGRGGPRARNCNGCAASCANGRSPTSARRAACGGAGCAAWRT